MYGKGSFRVIMAAVHYFLVVKRPDMSGDKNRKTKKTVVL